MCRNRAYFIGKPNAHICNTQQYLCMHVNILQYTTIFSQCTKTFLSTQQYFLSAQQYFLSAQQYFRSAQQYFLSAPIFFSMHRYFFRCADIFFEVRIYLSTFSHSCIQYIWPSALTFKELSLKIGILKSFKDIFKEFRFLRIFLRNFRNILSGLKTLDGG